MSRRVSNHHKSRQAEVTKFCKVCKDAGKPKSEYESHAPTNERGIVCCPTIKSHQCRKCSNTGHFDSYCQVKVADFATGIKKVLCGIVNAHEEKKKEPEKKTNTAGGRFALLDLGDNESSEDEVAPAEQPVAKKPTVRTPMARRDWANYSDSDSEDDEISPNVTLRAHQKKW